MLFKREIERKFVVQGSTYEEAANAVSLVARTIVSGNSFDLFWEAPGVDFVRLRENTRELTVKVTDRETVIDRIEENVEVLKDSMPAAKRLLTLLYGPPALKLTKHFSVYDAVIEPVPGTCYRAVISVYSLKEDTEGRVFFEVEADNLTVVDYILKSLDFGIKTTPEYRSLFQIFSNTYTPDEAA